MTEGLTTVFDRLHLSSLADGDWRRNQQGLGGLGRLTPLLYFGSDNVDDLTVEGYYNCSQLGQFRVAVREMRPKSTPAINPDTGTLNRAASGGDWALACPNMFDLDTRNLYFGQLNSNPADQQTTEGCEPCEVDDQRLACRDVEVGELPIGCEDEDGEVHFKGIELGTLQGRGVRGLPVRLQQVHFRAFTPQGQSDEYAAYFLCSNPVGPFGANPSRYTIGSPFEGINSDFRLQQDPAVDGADATHLTTAKDPLFWTYNNYTKDGEEDTAIRDFEGRIVMGNPLRVNAVRHYGLTPDGQSLTTIDDLPPMCPNPMNNCMEITFDLEGLIVKQRTKEGTERGYKYSLPMGVVVGNRYRFIEHGFDSSDVQLASSMYTCTAKPGWSMSNPEQTDLIDHIDMEIIECDETVTKKLLKRPDPLLNVGQADGLGDWLGKPGYPSASAIGSLDGANWESVPLLQLEDFCNVPQAFARDDLIIPVLRNCLGTREDHDDPDPLTPCDTTLEKICLKDIAQYVVDYLFDLINDSALDADLDEEDRPLRGLVTRVHATNCAIRYDFITAQGREVIGQGDDLNSECTTDTPCINGLNKSEYINQEVIPLTNCAGTCSEEETNDPAVAHQGYDRCKIDVPLDNPYTEEGACTPCVEDDERQNCKDAEGANLPEGTLPTGCTKVCVEDPDGGSEGDPCNSEFVGEAEMFTQPDPSAQTCTDARNASCPEEE